nr:MAG TPA: hypothetical protein [Caudoviricetes sp.]
MKHLSVSLILRFLYKKGMPEHHCPGILITLTYYI